MRFNKLQSLAFYCGNFSKGWNKFHQDTEFLRPIKGNKLLQNVKKLAIAVAHLLKLQPLNTQLFSTFWY